MNVLLILFALFGASIVLYYYWCTKWSRTAKLINRIPGPEPIPLLGNLYPIITPGADLWKIIRDINVDYYPISRMWVPVTPVVNIYHADDVEVILSNAKQISKNGLYKYLLPWFGTGLLTSTGSKWQKRRKLLTPAFHFNILQEYTNVFKKEAEYMIGTLREADGPVVKDLVKFISEHTLNAICETAMGTSLKDKGEFQYKYRRAVHDFGILVADRAYKLWLHFDVIYNLTPNGMIQKKLLKILHGFTTTITEERKKFHDSTNGIYLTDDCDGERTDQENAGNIHRTRKRKMALLDLLIAAQRDGDQIDDNGIREEVDTFMFEGHDTTAMALCFILLRLAEHKDVQEQARAEVNAIFHGNEGNLTMSALQSMQYLERCIKESLRLHPSVPFIARCLTSDMQFRKYLLPKGTRVHIHIYDLHRDANFWPNPEVYDPDRFLPENCRGRHPYCYVPFSAGPRNCIGQKFALTEMKIMVANILRYFHLEPIHRIKDIKMLVDLVYRPAHPLNVKFIPIKQV